MTITHTAAPTTTEQSTTAYGNRVELAAYRTDTQQDRRLIGQRIDGIVHIFDEPTNDNGTSYLVESGLNSNSELTALVNDYVAKADKLGYEPMHGWF